MAPNLFVGYSKGVHIVDDFPILNLQLRAKLFNIEGSTTHADVLRLASAAYLARLHANRNPEA